MKEIIPAFLMLLASCQGRAQSHPLKSTKYGLEMMLRAVPKEQLIEDFRFADGEDQNVDVLRLDHVGSSIHPLIISSKSPVAIDSLGILSMKLPKDTLVNLLDLVDRVTPKIQNRELDGVLIRITYRYKGRSGQYYLTNFRIVSGFVRMIEAKLIHNKDDKTLQIFYDFIAPMKLHKWENGVRVWRY